MNRKNTLIIILLMSLVVLSLGFFYFGKNFSPESRERGLKKISVGSAVVSVRLADNDLTRTKGLSDIVPLKDDEGMLFVFDQPLMPRFWMKDMRFSLDIIWISPEKKIISAEKNVLPESFPKTFSPKTPVQYVLEVPGGFFEKNNLREGDAVSW